MYPSSAIAYNLVKLANEEKKPISPLKLQKLLYLANGISLALYDSPLISDRFSAWKYGPVVKPIYHLYKSYGNSYIDVPKDDLVLLKDAFYASEVKLDDNAAYALRAGWTNGKELDPITLSNWTHAPNSPWDKAFNANPPKEYIDDDELKVYFKSLLS